MSAPVWRDRAQAHAQRVDALLGQHLKRRDAGIAHPVDDFMFSYYSYRPGQLRTWHPGYGVVLDGGSERYGHLRGYEITDDGGASVPQQYLTSQQRTIRGIRNLLRATEQREASYSCFGLHEWAMVYRSDSTRHGQFGLRLGAKATDAVVDSHRIACTHFDAFRFFTEPAIPLNELQPTSATREAFEQPGCLHAGMDLYKHAYRLAPLIDSGLIVDCFAHAHAVRELDIRASPYDLRELGYQPVAIETAEGKAAYVRAQRSFEHSGQLLRARLIDASEALLRVSV